MNISTFFHLSELIGSIAFAIAGVLVAKKQRLDLFGAIVLGVSTAVGGGVIRDILLGNLPPVMFKEPVYALAAFITSVIFFCVERHSMFLEKSIKAGTLLNVADTIGLGVFASSGTEMVIQSRNSTNAFLAVFVGVLTAVGGGVLRDMLAGTIPVVMRKRIYAVAALSGTVVYYILRRVLSAPQAIAEVATVTVIAVLRFLAIRYLWNLPAFDAENQS